MVKALEVSGISYTYPDGTRALEDISFSAEAGECLGLVGASGSGKSTLCHCLVGLIMPEVGKIRILGEELNKKNLSRLRQKINLVFQNPDDQLFMPTLYEDVAFGLIQQGLQGKDLEERVKKALAEYGLEKLAGKFPGHLSGGQKRLATLAGIMVMQPEILVLDEPSSNLDPLSRRNLIQQLDRIQATRIIAGHDLEMVLELCHRVLVLKEGKIIADGVPARIFRNADLMLSCHLEVPHSLLPHQNQHHRIKA